MSRVLVIGASGFLGRHVAQALLADGHAVRCLSRNLSRVQVLAAAGCEVEQGDISDPESLRNALESVSAVYVSIHTLSPQPGSAPGDGFMEVERKGLENIVAACRAKSVRRLIYVTFLGISAESPSAWVRGRWQAEQFLLKSGLDVTVLRPAQIVGMGGRGFDMMVGNAQKAVAITIANRTQKMRNIAVGDLVYYMVGVLNDARSYGQCYDVGCDDVLTNDRMLDMTAEVLGRKPPLKVHVPRMLLGAMAPLIERMSKMPRGALKGILDSLGTDSVGDPLPIRAILPRPLLSYRKALEQALIK